MKAATSGGAAISVGLALRTHMRYRVAGSTASIFIAFFGEVIFAVILHAISRHDTRATASTPIVAARRAFRLMLFDTIDERFTLLIYMR